MKRIPLLLVVLVILLSLPLMVAGQSAPDTLVLTWSRQPDSLFWDYAQTSTASYAMSAIYSSLVTTDLQGNVVGELAESWEVSDDQLTWTFKLRQNVKWHDGEPFTAADVKFSFEFPADPDYTGSAFNDTVLGAQEKKDGEAEEVVGVQVIDDYTVSITTTEPLAIFLDTTAQRYILPEHILGSVPVADLGTSVQARSPIGTGPYRLLDWKADELLTYERFDDYFGEPARIKNYFWKIIPERSVQITELLGGTVDIVPEVPADEFESLASEPGISSLQLPGVNTPQVLMNGSKPFFSDVRVRKALVQAMDRHSMLAVMNAGLGIVVDTQTHPSVPEYAAMEPYPYDPQAARDLLAEAGWTDDDGDGIVESHGVEGLDDGTPFSVELGTLGFSPYSDSAQIIQQNLAEVGIEVTLNVVDFNIYFSEYLSATSDYDFAMSGWFNFVVPTHNEFAGAMASDGSNTAWVHWGNDEVDVLLQEAQTTFDPQARYPLYHRVQEIVQDEAPYIYVARPDNLIAHNENLIIPEIGSLTALFNSIPMWEWAQ